MAPKKAANASKAKAPASKALAPGRVKKNAAAPKATSTAKAAPKRKTSSSEPAARKTKTVAPKGASKASSSTNKKVATAAAKPAAHKASASSKTAVAPKASASSKTAAAPVAKPTANESKKRKTAVTDEAADETENAAPPTKKARVAAPKAPVAAPKAPKAPKVAKKGPVINEAPKQRLHVYVFGEGSSGELGLGTAKNAIDVKRPRLNPHLTADTVGVVQIATGGMHVAALTHDNRILTWGVNDQGALGRDTTWEGGLRDMDANDSDSDAGSDSGLNPKESTPTAIPSDSFPTGTVFVEVAAGDSTTFALTDEGLVYGWGTFRSNEGILGFTVDTHVQTMPALVSGVKKIKHLVCGANHVLALTQKGAVYAWGAGQQNQLGRRVVERTRMNGLVPREFGLPKNKITYVKCGAYHSFAIDTKGQVWTWGLNNYGETGITEGAGEDEAVVLAPTVVKSLQGKELVNIDGGAHHSVAVTKDGECLVWGRIDGFQSGIKISSLPKEDIVFDERDHPRILKKPTPVPGIKATFAAAGSDHCICITEDGKAWSWGFSANYQTGLGTDDDVEVATMIDNTAVRTKVLNWAGAGGQYSILTALAGEEGEALTNGL
ncbi:MAG: ran exchange factor Prp20 Pim1 [Lasallia pustulata]|uniref:Ran exchange factor Prp20 Pim1 n=1 Tax=Lasallia pustulata TaxID=136370 RepID=A0A5M8PU97_9LECA|nr:MAG: ran exchange factor Prp20 Pim1 [Lasallia pustulata]